MYFVDRKLMEERLNYFEEIMGDFSKAGSTETPETRLAVERICHMMIEVIMDVGNQMIDGFIMRDPGSYEDIIHILADEKVLSKEEADALEALIPWRKELLQHYTTLDVAGMYDDFNNKSDALINFPGKIRKYLENELGPVSAFLPQKD
jgi:uncharacterized protein YutE (UPF0331/DUF86 family)